MKIAINHTRFSSTGGVERYLFNLVSHLLAAGHEIHYYCYKWERFSHPRLFFHRVPYLKGIRSLKILSFALCSRFLLARQTFDLVLGFGKTYYQDIYRDGTGCLKDYQEYSLSVIRNPVRRFLRKLSPYQYVIQFIENKRYAPGNFRKIVANSEFVKNQILHRHHLSSSDVEVVYSGSDCETFSPARREQFRETIRREFGILPEDFLILFVGNDFLRKGLDTVIRAMPHLLTPLPQSKLLIVGKDRHEDTFRSQVQRLGLETTVKFAGHRRETASFYAAADLLVLPSRFDPFPNVILEAMASGLPTIVTELSGAAEIVDGIGLVLKNPESETELAAQIMRLADKNLRTEMGANARKRAETLNWERHVTEMLSIFHEVHKEKLTTFASGRAR